nr:Chain C, Sorting nexin 5 [synthetic construct]
EEPTVIKKY